MLNIFKTRFMALIAMIITFISITSKAGLINTRISDLSIDNGCYDFVQSWNWNPFIPADTLRTGMTISTPLPANRIVDPALLGNLIDDPTPEGVCPVPNDVICCIMIYNDRILLLIAGTLATDA